MKNLLDIDSHDDGYDLLNFTAAQLRCLLDMAGGKAPPDEAAAREVRALLARAERCLALE